MADSRRVVLTLAAGPHERFAAHIGERLIGQEFDLDERIAGISELVVQSLSADERGLWTRARVVGIEPVDDGSALRVTVETI